MSASLAKAVINHKAALKLIQLLEETIENKRPGDLHGGMSHNRTPEEGRYEINVTTGEDGDTIEIDLKREDSGSSEYLASIFSEKISVPQYSEEGELLDGPDGLVRYKSHVMGLVLAALLEGSAE